MKNRLIKRALSFAAAVVLSGAPALALPPATQPAEKLTKEQTDFFESKVRPILVAHCYKCHSVEEKKSKGGLAYGSTDEFGDRAVDKKVHVHDLQATILHLLGLDPHKLSFPYQGLNQRLIGPAEDPKVIHDLIA